MKNVFLLLLVFAVFLQAEVAGSWKMKLKDLTPFEQYVVNDKGTERAFSGKYVNTSEKGVYRCKVCDKPLYRSDDKFSSHCGWPSFDDAIPGAIKEVPDRDGRRTEIVCANCGAHLGHVFRGEGLTKKNVRHCVNSVSLHFDKKKKAVKTELARAYFAGGCFWGVEYYLEKIKGVKEVTSGFMGGKVKNPTYEQVFYDQDGTHRDCRSALRPFAGQLRNVGKDLLRDPRSYPEGRTGTRYRCAVSLRHFCQQ